MPMVVVCSRGSDPSSVRAGNLCESVGSRDKRGWEPGFAMNDQQRVHYWTNVAHDVLFTHPERREPENWALVQKALDNGADPLLRVTHGIHWPDVDLLEAAASAPQIQVFQGLLGRGLRLRPCPASPLGHFGILDVLADRFGADWPPVVEMKGLVDAVRLADSLAEQIAELPAQPAPARRRM